MSERSRLKNLINELNSLMTDLNALTTNSNNLTSNLITLNTGILEENVDSLTETKKRMSLEHYEIHKGGSYTVSVVDESMGDNDTLIIAFQTGTPEIHVVISYDCKVSCHVDLIENPSWDSTSGSAVTIFNRNRNSPNTSTVKGNKSGVFVANQIVENPTNLAGGTVLPPNYAFGTKQGGLEMIRGQHEFILKTDEEYAIRLTADGESNAGFIKLNWYEND